MHFLLRLLRIKDLYMFRALLAHLQEALHKLHLVYYVRVMSVGWTKTGAFKGREDALHTSQGLSTKPIPIVL
jgi:hypothetical protein